MPKPSLLRYLIAPLLAIAAVAWPLREAVGHAVVVGTSLKEQPVRAQTAAKVTLKFNSAVEAKLSRVFLVSKGDNHRPLAIAAGFKRGELIVELPGLPEGDYALKYRVLAADGHLTEDVIRFHVSR